MTTSVYFGLPLTKDSQDHLTRAVNDIYEDGKGAGYRDGFKDAAAFLQGEAGRHRQEGRHQVADALFQASIDMRSFGDRRATAAADIRAQGGNPLTLVPVGSKPATITKS
ncbi:hypothetical protein [Nitrospirillum amazonense]|uniref:hypothetical protein n=1 Tax=Nitrospirillum amazonense TaxID=28077 RepID=UPI0024124D9A|nr:hypothetical protein [Nitrospirillum amazonense]MDG3444670.1 hypothetical protein [Nitrospirillum amazonense]